MSASVGSGFDFKQRAARHHHAGRAVAALQAVLLVEALLDRIELAVLLEPLDGHDLAAVGLHGEDRAGLDRDAVEQDRAGAAVRRVAADVRAGQPQVLAQEMDEEEARLDLGSRARRR